MDDAWALALDSFPVGCLVTDAGRRICYANAFFREHFGYAERDPVGTPLLSLLSRGSQIICDSYLMPLILNEGQCHEIRLSLVDARGDARPVVVSARREPASGEAIYWSVLDAARSEQMFQELTRARELLQQKNQQLHTLAESDPLTGLPNRSAFTRRLGELIRNTPAPGPAFALAFVDLDGFKAVNDTHGHAVGDALLRLAARRMSATLRSDDLVARFGGDEFVILLHGDFSAGAAEQSLYRLVHHLSEPFEVDTRLLQISASVGVTRHPQAQACEPDTLIRQADQAMYQAKLDGRNRLCWFPFAPEPAAPPGTSELSASPLTPMAPDRSPTHEDPTRC
ncbi:MAG: diguanylate cyclase domain-containing protein [Halomonas sp.]